MSLSSDEVNFLVYRYLLEAGFSHAAFVFGCESSVAKAGIPGKAVPVGALVSFIQKGFQYMELEANLNEEGSDVYGEYTPLSARDLLTRDIEDLRLAVAEMKERRAEAGRDDFLASGPLDVPPGAVAELPGAEGETLTLGWCPAAPLLATACDAGPVRLWDMGASGPGAARPAALLNHEQRKGGEQRAVGVSSMEWAPDGSLLGTGATDGTVRVWSREGALRSVLEGHAGATMGLRWNRKGDLLLTGGVDHAAIVWDVKAGTARQRWSSHSDAVLDVDWKNNSTFATCSQDRTIVVQRLGDPKPLRVWAGHSGDINSIRWEPSAGKQLASASDDGTVRIWGTASDKPLHTLTGHLGAVSLVRWGSSGGQAVLASCGGSGGVRVWDPESGACMHSFEGHADVNVSVVSWSPEGDYLASGDVAGEIFVWSLRRGEAVRRLRAPRSGGGGERMVYDIRWDESGERLAACYQDDPAAAGSHHPALVVELKQQ